MTSGRPQLRKSGCYQWSPSVTTAVLRRRSNPMPTAVPNFNYKTDRIQFGTLIGRLRLSRGLDIGDDADRLTKETLRFEHHDVRG